MRGSVEDSSEAVDKELWQHGASERGPSAGGRINRPAHIGRLGDGCTTRMEGAHSLLPLPPTHTRYSPQARGPPPHCVLDGPRPALPCHYHAALAALALPPRRVIISCYQPSLASGGCSVTLLCVHMPGSVGRGGARCRAAQVHDARRACLGCH